MAKDGRRAEGEEDLVGGWVSGMTWREGDKVTGQGPRVQEDGTGWPWALRMW